LIDVYKLQKRKKVDVSLGIKQKLTHYF